MSPPFHSLPIGKPEAAGDYLRNEGLIYELKQLFALPGIVIKVSSFRLK